MASVLSKVAAKARQKRIDTAQERLKVKAREKRQKALALANASTPDGYNPKKRAKLQAAALKSAEDPRSMRIVEDASRVQRLEALRRTHHIGNVAPPVFAGEPLQPHEIPKSVAQQLNEEKAMTRTLHPGQERHTVDALRELAGIELPSAPPPMGLQDVLTNGIARMGSRASGKQGAVADSAHFEPGDMAPTVIDLDGPQTLSGVDSDSFGAITTVDQVTGTITVTSAGYTPPKVKKRGGRRGPRRPQ